MTVLLIQGNGLCIMHQAQHVALGVTFAAPGTYYLSAKAEDNHGAQSTFSAVLTVVISSWYK